MDAISSVNIRARQKGNELRIIDFHHAFLRVTFQPPVCCRVAAEEPISRSTVTSTCQECLKTEKYLCRISSNCTNRLPFAVPEGSGSDKLKQNQVGNIYILITIDQSAVRKATGRGRRHEAAKNKQVNVFAQLHRNDSEARTFR